MNERPGFESTILAQMRTGLYIFCFLGRWVHLCRSFFVRIGDIGLTNLEQRSIVISTAFWDQRRGENQLVFANPLLEVADG